MSFSVTMPALGESVSEGTVTRWLKKEGDQVEVDEPLLEVSTDKVDTEIPSPAAGVLQRIVVGEDETVDVGAELAVIGDAAGGGGGQPAEASAAATQADAPQQDADPAPAQASYEPPAPRQEQAQPEQQAPAGGSQGGGAPQGVPVTMPALGESVSEGTVTRWLKQVGETVEVDEPLLEVSTDKVDTEIPSPVAGTVLAISVGEDETVPVGAELAVVGDPSAQGGAPAQQAPQQEQREQPQVVAAAPQQQAPQQQAPQQQAPQQQPQQVPPVTEEPQPTVPAATPAQASTQPTGEYAPAESREGQGGGAQAPTGTGAVAGTPAPEGVSPYVTPLVRKLAAEHGVDLASVQGTGVGGRIRKQDVLEAAEKAKAPAPAAPAAAQQAAPAAPAAPATAGGSQAAPAAPAVSPLRGTSEKMSRLRKVIATRMVESLQVSAQLTSVVEVDLTRVAQLRARAKRDFEAREGVKLSYLPFLAKAAVEALKAHPKVNASIEGDTIVYHGQENLAVAVDTERGLLVPVVKDAGDLNIGGLARKIADLAARTRDNKITPDEMSGGTFTLTNTGSRGALFDTPIINQPQVAILGTGALVKRPVVIDHPELGETIAVRHMMYLALSYDHRLVDGADAARFLTTMKQRLEAGAFEADLGL
ncbi:2-oxoglutarate dehydrogenase, E2 component, dihydrolipoamide succinyltransferase [Vallicoccus soli]|uniref:Dihydrolipoamide acetyltransferase component of pyruvate dehydrogenase complex n=1 Tax=Vallicoccus soli TaxID=2339232 RepID=A0A3A3Z5D9_9ACTN|nr:2-oxoglutarate dehydrogenase, E2 component, dihydrolipoamide succinyltransferase [Vallicoccus soli]RJK96928.1 2-oxoglutarate dehydrogenase, E2 component, dihydrolipoamide succinyltransferase [Vallicoccus soli]